MVVLVRWTTGGTWLAGVTCPTTVLAGTSMACELMLCRQIGTLEEPGCSSPYGAIGTTAASNWGPRGWLRGGHALSCSALLHQCFPLMLKFGTGEL